MLDLASPEADPPAIPDDDDATTGPSVEGEEPPTKKRRLLLRTMGQQLREVRSGQDSELPGQESFSSLNGDRNGRLFIQNIHNGLSPSDDRHRRVQIDTPESDAVPGDDDDQHGHSGLTRSATKWLWLPDEIIDDNNSIFTFDQLLAWTQSYFDDWHPAYPFVHAPSMLDYFQRVVGEGIHEAEPDDPFLAIILRSMLSISIHDRRQTGSHMTPVPANLVFKSFSEAINGASQALLHESSILSLQAVLAVELFLVSMLRYNAASRIAGVAVRIAYQLGLHRCPRKLTGNPSDDSRLKQRVFWSLYLLDRQICPRLGLPLAVADGIIDVCYPGHEKHRKLQSEGQLAHDPRLDYLVFLAQNAKIRGSVLDLRNHPATTDARAFDHKVMTINTNLTKWWNEVEEYLDVTEMPSAGASALPLRPSQCTTLHLLKSESIIALNRSILATSKSSSSYSAALQNCIGAARSTINILHSALQAGTPLLWPSTTWALWMSAFIMVHAASESQITADTAVRFVDRTLPVLQHLSCRGSSWPDACLVAIKGLRKELIETRTKDKIRSSNLAAARHDESQLGKPVQNRIDIPTNRTGNQTRPRHPRQSDSATAATPSQKAPQMPDNSSSSGTNNTLNSSLAFWTAPVGRTTGDVHGIDLQESPSQTNYRYRSGSNVHVQDFSPWNAVPGGQMFLPGDPVGTMAGGDEQTDLFYGSDIPFWLGDDQAIGFGF